jgi:hypothetical protein
MTIEEFKSSLEHKQPPDGLDHLLLALWYDARGDWDKSHSIVQDIETRDAALIHAYLHRKEGDLWNADYWYTRAGTNRIEQTLEREWNSLVTKFLTY